MISTKKIRTVGSYEAKTHLPSLLKEVASGREILITRRDRPIARLVPVSPALPEPDNNFFKRMRAFRERHVLPKGETTRDLVQAGRRI
jgi:prevent-host-death family protein